MKMPTVETIYKWGSHAFIFTICSIAVPFAITSIEHVGGQLEDHGQSLAKLNQSVLDIQGTVNDIKSSVGSLNNQVVGLNNTEAQLNTRVAVLEAKQPVIVNPPAIIERPIIAREASPSQSFAKATAQVPIVGPIMKALSGNNNMIRKRSRSFHSGR